MLKKHSLLFLKAWKEKAQRALAST